MTEPAADGQGTPYDARSRPLEGTPDAIGVVWAGVPAGDRSDRARARQASSVLAGGTDGRSSDRSTEDRREAFDRPWIAVAFEDGAFHEAVVAEEVGAIWGRYGEDAEWIVVGIPAGLVEDDDPERQCDELARAAVGERADAVVTPPSREATRRRRYPAARRVHERTTGGELSPAAFAYAPAIAALDELLQEVPASRPVVRSGHPELAYRAFAGEPTVHPPSTAGGYAERMRALVEHDRDAPPTVQEAAESVAGADVAVADVQDALALAYTARPEGAELRSLPPEPPTDPTGLPVAWHYRSETALDVA